MPAPRAAERRQQQREDVRRAILDASEALLAEGGTEGFSMRALAGRCGYTAPTIYHHFGDKTGLLDAVLDERFAALVRLLRRVPRREDPVETIRARALAFLRFGLRHPTHYRLLTLARGAEPRALPSVETSRGFLERPWRELVETGRLQVPDIASAQNALWAMLHGLISLGSGRPDLGWSRAGFERCIDAVLRGLAEPPPARSKARRSRKPSS